MSRLFSGGLDWCPALAPGLILLAFAAACADAIGPGDEEPTGPAYRIEVIHHGVLATFTGSSFPPAKPIAALNEMGDVVFTSEDLRAFAWRDGSLVSLGEGFAYDINARGQIAGSLGGAAVVWDESGVRRTVLEQPGGIARAVGINDSGQVVAYWTSSRECGAGSRCRTETAVVEGGTSSVVSRDVLVPVAINASGWITGWHRAPDHRSRPFVLRGDTLVQFEVAGYPAPHVFAWGINARGDVVGSQDTHGGDGQFWPAEGGVLRLPGGDAGYYTISMGINDQGEIVGMTYVGSGPLSEANQRAALWREGELTILDDVVPEEWNLRVGIAISNRGQILATGLDRSTGEPALLLLTPA